MDWKNVNWKPIKFFAYTVAAPALIYWLIFRNFSPENDAQTMTAVFLAVAGLVTFCMREY